MSIQTHQTDRNTYFSDRYTFVTILIAIAFYPTLFPREAWEIYIATFLQIILLTNIEI